MPLPLIIPILAGTVVGGVILAAIFGGGPKPGDTVESGTSQNQHNTWFDWRIQFASNEDAPYVAQVKLSGFGGPEQGWDFVGGGKTIEAAKDVALTHIAQRPEGA